MNRRLIFLVPVAVAFTSGLSVFGRAPTLQDLMDPSCLPEAQHGMRVENARIDDGRLHVETTGASLEFERTTNTAVFHQRIGVDRPVLRVVLEGASLDPPQLAHNTSGLAFARFGSRLDLRANGDSLFLLHAHTPSVLRVERLIEPAFHASYRTHHVVADERGGFALFASNPGVTDEFDVYRDRIATYQLPANGVLAIGICPPKPYDWEASLKNHVVWHWSNVNAYPPDHTLAEWSHHGNRVLLQSEVMLWKDWNLGFEPRLGPAEFSRVRKTLHEMNMRFLVYTSPFYFLRGTPFERSAMNSFENFTNWPQGTATGENMELFLAEIETLLRTHRPDGLYFDGQYTDNPAALYLLARRTRKLLGDNGLLEWHSTNALGPDLCSMPQADAYVDFILRGEGREAYYADEGYLRYFVSGFNVSNSIGVLCNNGTRPTGELIERLLNVNGRMHTLAGWLTDPVLAKLVEEKYRSNLNPALRDRVIRLADQRHAQNPRRFATLRNQHETLLKPPSWTEPTLRGITSLEEWKRVSSPLNAKPFVLESTTLALTSRANTYAYLSRELTAPVQGVVLKIRQGTDGGQGWGPGFVLHWPGGTTLKVGVRSDKKVQVNTSGIPFVNAPIEERLVGHTDATQWTWLRARWSGPFGVIEQSADGEHFERIWELDHKGILSNSPRDICVGKIPYNGKPEDYAADPGPAGTCEIGFVAVY